MTPPKKRNVGTPTFRKPLLRRGIIPPEPMQYVMWLGMTTLRKALEIEEDERSRRQLAASLENFYYHLPQFVQGMALYAEDGELLATTSLSAEEFPVDAHAAPRFTGALGELAISAAWRRFMGIT